MYEQHQQNHHRHHHYSDNPTFAIPTSQQDELSMTYSQFVFDDQTLAALDTQDLSMKYMQLLESSNHEIGNEPRQVDAYIYIHSTSISIMVFHLVYYLITYNLNMNI